MQELDALMQLSHELGEVDDETWQLWQEGRTTTEAGSSSGTTA